MDLIAQLSSAMGVSDSGAKTAAGAVLGLVQDKLGESDPTAAEGLASSVPELEDWKAQAESAAGTTEDEGFLGGLGGLLGGAGGLLGKAGAAAGAAQDIAMVSSVLEKVGIDGDKAAMAAPLVLKFLESRVSPELMGKARAAAPFLGLSGSSSAASTASGVLGSLFK